MTTIEKARKILDPQKLHLPERPPIEAIKVEDYVDSEGEDALRVQVILGEDTDDEELTGDWGLDLDLAIRDALQAQGIKEFPYVFVSKQSELDSLEESE